MAGGPFHRDHLLTVAMQAEGAGQPSQLIQPAAHRAQSGSIFPRRMFAESAAISKGRSRSQSDVTWHEARRARSTLVRDRDWCASGNGFEEILRHEFRHPNATMRSRITRQIAGMHAGTVCNAHVVRHRRALEVGAGRLRIFFNIDIRLHHIVVGIDVIAVSTGGVTDVFLEDRKMPDGRLQPFASGGELRHTDEQAVFIKISALLEEADFDGGPAANTIAIPVGNAVLRRPDGRRRAVNAAKVLSLPREPSVLLATDHKRYRA